MQPAVDPDDCLTLLRQPPCLFVGEALRVREPRGDVAIMFQSPLVRGRRHDRHEVWTPFRRLADLLQHDAIGLLRQRAPVGRELGVVREEVVVAEVGAERFLRRRDVVLCRYLRGQACDERREGQQDRTDAAHAETLDARDDDAPRRMNYVSRALGVQRSALRDQACGAPSGAVSSPLPHRRSALATEWSHR